MAGSHCSNLLAGLQFTVALVFIVFADIDQVRASPFCQLDSAHPRQLQRLRVSSPSTDSVAIALNSSAPGSPLSWKVMEGQSAGAAYLPERCTVIISLHLEIHCLLALSSFCVIGRAIGLLRLLRHWRIFRIWWAFHPTAFIVIIVLGLRDAFSFCRHGCRRETWRSRDELPSMSGRDVPRQDAASRQ